MMTQHLQERLFGIDVSHHQGSVDWAKARAAGVQFAFIKATEGGTFVDPQFSRNRRALKEAGIPCGAYHFFRTTSSLEAQVANFIRTVGKLEQGELPPVLDIEVPEQWQNLSLAERLALVHGFCHAVEKKLGVKPILYLSPSFAKDVLRGEAGLKRYLLWLAHYTTAAEPRTPAPWTDWHFWQYSENGTVDGIANRSVDMNRLNGGQAELDAIKVRAAQVLPNRMRHLARLWWWMTGWIEREPDEARRELTRRQLTGSGRGQ